MSLYKLVKREQRIKDLMNSLPDKENNSKRLYLIDSSFKHEELKQCGKVEKTLFNAKIQQLIQKQREHMRKEAKKDQAKGHNKAQQTLNTYVKKQHHYRALQQSSAPLLKKHLYQNEVKTKKIYLERKYNATLAYQMHTILQAKKIEEQRQKFNYEIQKVNQSPLIRNVMKVTYNEGHNYQPFMTNNFFDPFSNFEHSAVELSRRKKILQNKKIQDAMDARERKYVPPETYSTKKALKRHDSADLPFYVRNTATSCSSRRPII